jgi:hypothetical protein
LKGQDFTVYGMMKGKGRLKKMKINWLKHDFNLSVLFGKGLKLNVEIKDVIFYPKIFLYEQNPKLLTHSHKMIGHLGKSFFLELNLII